MGNADWRPRLLEAAADGGADNLILLTSRSARLMDSALASEEATKLFDFLPEVGAVCGRLRKDEVIVAAGWSADEAGYLRAPYDGLPVGNAGAFALAWKPQAISVGILDCCIVRASSLREAVKTAPRDCAAVEFGFWLGSFIASQNGLVAYSPVIEAELIGVPFGSANLTDANTIWRHFNQISGASSWRARGAAGYPLSFSS